MDISSWDVVCARRLLDSMVFDFDCTSMPMRSTTVLGTATAAMISGNDAIVGQCSSAVTATDASRFGRIPAILRPMSKLA